MDHPVTVFTARTCIMANKIVLIALSVVTLVTAQGTSHTSVARAGESEFVYDIEHSNPGSWHGTAAPYGYGGLGTGQGSGLEVGGLPHYRHGSYNGLGHGIYGNRANYVPGAYNNFGTAYSGYSATPYTHGNAGYVHGSGYNAIPYSTHRGSSYGAAGYYDRGINTVPYGHGIYSGYGGLGHSGYSHGMYSGYGGLGYGGFGRGYAKHGVGAAYGDVHKTW